MNLRKTIPLLIVFMLLLATQIIDAQWAAPLGTPSASNNASTTINLSSTNQIKLGDITALNLKAGGTMWAPQYCDQTGNNCSTPAQVTNVINNGASFAKKSGIAMDTKVVVPIAGYTNNQCEMLVSPRDVGWAGQNKFSGTLIYATKSGGNFTITCKSRDNSTWVNEQCTYLMICS